MISSKSDLIHIFNDFIHVYSPGARAEKTIGDKPLMYIAPGQGQTTLCGQNPYVNRKALSLWPFVASFKKKKKKKNLWSLILYIFFHVFIHVYSPGSSFEQTIMGPRPQCYIPSHKVIGPLVHEKKIFERFLPFLPYMGVVAILVMWPRSREQTFVPLNHGGSTWNLASIGPAVLEKKMVDGRTTDGRRSMPIL